MDNDKPSIAELQRIFERPHVLAVVWLGPNEVIVSRDTAAVLIELAAAALALREQEQFAAQTKARWYGHARRQEADSKEAASDYAATWLEDRKLAQCQTRYQVALAKVRA